MHSGWGASQSQATMHIDTLICTKVQFSTVNSGGEMSPNDPYETQIKLVKVHTDWSKAEDWTRALTATLSFQTKHNQSDLHFLETYSTKEAISMSYSRNQSIHTINSILHGCVIWDFFNQDVTRTWAWYGSYYQLMIWVSQHFKRHDEK